MNDFDVVRDALTWLTFASPTGDEETHNAVAALDRIENDYGNLLTLERSLQQAEAENTRLREEKQALFKRLESLRLDLWRMNRAMRERGLR